MGRNKAWWRGLRGAHEGWIGSLLFAAACTTSGGGGGDTVTVNGRAFSADTATALAGAKVAAGNSRATTDAQGNFKLSYRAAQKPAVELSGKSHAPVKKPAPEGDGYLELMSKRLDVEQEIEAAAGGTVKAKGASVKIPANTLRTDDAAETAAVKAKVSMAVPDPRKSQDLSALPGNSDAQKGQKRGKISLESPVYLSAEEGQKKLKVAGGKAKISVPAHTKDVQKNHGGAHTLFRFDEATGLWVEVGSATLGQDENGEPIYEGEVDQLGWFAVGEFFEQLACVRACVVDGDGSAVPFARAVASGVEDFTQSTAFADEEGCFAVEVRAGARFTLGVQAKSGFAAAVLAEGGSGGRLEDPSSCANLGEVTLSPRGSDACPSGFRSCESECVDLSSDADHCGTCDNACEGASCIAGSCGDAPVLMMDAGVSGRDGGEADVCTPGTICDGGASDAGTMLEDATVPPDATASDAMAPLDAMTTSDATVLKDASTTDAGACTPTTCAGEGWECGLLPDGCGGLVSCGSCASGSLCSSGECMLSTCATTGEPCTTSTDCCSLQCDGTMCVSSGA